MNRFTHKVLGFDIRLCFRLTVSTATSHQACCIYGSQHSPKGLSQFRNLTVSKRMAYVEHCCPDVGLMLANLEGGKQHSGEPLFFLHIQSHDNMRADVSINNPSCGGCQKRKSTNCQQQTETPLSLRLWSHAPPSLLYGIKVVLSALTHAICLHLSLPHTHTHKYTKHTYLSGGCTYVLVLKYISHILYDW